jgi:L-ascorbate 6-phosphate lactonase
MQPIHPDDLKNAVVPKGAVTIWWLGQGGFLVKSPGGVLVAVDPYLSNSCKRIGEKSGYDMDRRVPPPLAPTDIKGIDLYAITHSHQDHLDPETLRGYRDAGGTGPYLAPAETCEKLKSLSVPAGQIVMTWPNHVHRVGDVSLRATFAIPLGGDDLTHVGYLLFVDDGPTVWMSGDTGYHELVAATVAEHRPDVVFPVINGTFRNMTPSDAARLTRIVQPRLVIPCHYDLFPANAVSPELLRSNLRLLGLADRYRVLEQGEPFTYRRA